MQTITNYNYSNYLYSTVRDSRASQAEKLSRKIQYIKYEV